MNPYENTKNLKHCTVKERIKFAKQAAITLLQTQKLDMGKLGEEAEECVSNEQYEIAEGAKLAAEKFKQNPQLSLF